MSKMFTIFLVIGLALLAACTPAVSQSGEKPQDLPLLDSWTGDYPVAALDQLPAGQQQNHLGYIGDEATFAAVWKAYMPAEPVPTVDFALNLVVFSRNVEYYNRTNILKVALGPDGVVEVLAIETMSAMPVKEKAAMAMAVIPRAGVVRIRTGEKTSIAVD